MSLQRNAARTISNVKLHLVSTPSDSSSYQWVLNSVLINSNTSQRLRDALIALRRALIDAIYARTSIKRFLTDKLTTSAMNLIWRSSVLFVIIFIYSEMPAQNWNSRAHISCIVGGYWLLFATYDPLIQNAVHRVLVASPICGVTNRTKSNRVESSGQLLSVECAVTAKYPLNIHDEHASVLTLMLPLCDLRKGCISTTTSLAMACIPRAKAGRLGTAYDRSKICINFPNSLSSTIISERSLLIIGGKSQYSALQPTLI